MLSRALAGFATCVAAILALGCASTTFATKIESIGEFRDPAPLVEQARQMSNADAVGVKAYMGGNYPEGISFQDSKIIADPSRFQLLGAVEARQNDGLLAGLGWWIYDYREDERWRVGYCAWQVPLGWVTVGLWGLVPIHYPCGVLQGTEEDRRAEIVRTLQKATKSLGGDVLVVTHFGILHGPLGADAASEYTRATLGTGYALRAKTVQ
jgi:hypothetical protein